MLVGGNKATGPHADTGHSHSSNNSVTLHLNVWNSFDYILGNSSSGPWGKLSNLIYWYNLKGFAIGKFGELDCWYDKAEFKFIFGPELSHVRGDGSGIFNFTKQPCPAIMKLIRYHNAHTGEIELIIVPNDHKPKKKGKRKKNEKSVELFNKCALRAINSQMIRT